MKRIPLTLTLVLAFSLTALAQSNVIATDCKPQPTASSTYPGTGFHPLFAINGDRKGSDFGGGKLDNGGWNDQTRDQYPDWYQLNFCSPKRLTEIRVFTLSDSPGTEPDDTTTATLYGLIDFDVQVWDGRNWNTVGSARGNDKAKRVFTFPEVTTSAIRVHVLNSRTHFSRIIEVEAAGPPQ